MSAGITSDTLSTMDFALMTVKDVARALKITRIGVQKMIERGVLVPAGRVGNQHVFLPADVKLQVRARRAAAKTKTA